MWSRLKALFRDEPEEVTEKKRMQAKLFSVYFQTMNKKRLE